MLNCNIMIYNNTISRFSILTNPVLINDSAGFYTCLQFDKAGFQKHLSTSRFRPWLVTNWLFLNKIISLSKINNSLIIFLFLATFHSFVNARYSDISIDCNDFDAGFLVTFRKNIILHCKKQWYLDKKWQW